MEGATEKFHPFLSMEAKKAPQNLVQKTLKRIKGTIILVLVKSYILQF